MKSLAKTFMDLLVWQKAHLLVLAAYKITESFPKNELFGLTSQLRRAAVSIPANIAEGFRKQGHQDKLSFYNIAQGSLEETRYYLMLTKDLGYAETVCIFEQLEEVSKLLDAYIRTIRNSHS